MPYATILFVAVAYVLWLQASCCGMSKKQVPTCGEALFLQLLSTRWNLLICHITL